MELIWWFAKDFPFFLKYSEKNSTQSEYTSNGTCKVLDKSAGVITSIMQKFSCLCAVTAEVDAASADMITDTPLHILIHNM